MTEPQPTPDTVYSLAASPVFSRDGICFAGRTSGLYRSGDGGQTWHDAFASMHLGQPIPATAVAVSPDFAADQTVFAGAPGGVLRSYDGGHTWHFAVLPTPPPVITTLAVSPAYAEDGTVWAGTAEDGIYCSTDRGVRWTPWNFGLLDLGVLALAVSPAFAADETLYAGTETGLYRSTNGGRAWREVERLPEVAPVLSLAISPAFADDGCLWAGTESHGLFVSHDRGQSWLPVGANVLSGAINGIVLAPRYPAQPFVLVVLEGTLAITHDGGTTWQPWDAGFAPGEGLVCGAAPLGLDTGTPLLIGLAASGVWRV